MCVTNLKLMTAKIRYCKPGSLAKIFFELLFVTFFMTINISSFSQTKEEINRLTNDLDSSISDTNKVNILNNLSRKTHSFDYKRSLNYAQQAFNLADSLNFQRGIMKAYTNIAYAYISMGKTVQAKGYLDTAVELAKKFNDKEQMVIIYNYYYLLFNKIESFEKASEYAFKALNLSEEIGFKAGIAAISINISRLYSNRSDTVKEKEYLNRALKISKEINHKKKIALINHNLGVIALDNNKLDQALEYFNKSLKTYNNLKNFRGLVFLYTNIGITLKKKGDTANALMYYRKSLDYAKRLKDSLLIGTISDVVASYFFSTGNYDSAKYYAQKAYQINTKINNTKNIMEDAYLLYQINYKNKKYKQASDFLKIHTQMKDSMVLKERKMKITNLEAQYNLNKLEKKIQLIKMKNNIFKIKSISLIIFLILISIIVFQRINKKRIKNTKDKEIYALKLMKAQATLKQKEAELKNFALTILDKNKEINKLQNEITAEERCKNINSNLINHKKEKLRNLRIVTEDDWLKFKNIFTEVYPKFIDKVTLLNPELSEGDKRQLMLVKLGFTINQSAEILGVGYKSIQKARQRLAKKLQLESSKQLLQFVKKIDMTT